MLYLVRIAFNRIHMFTGSEQAAFAQHTAFARSGEFSSATRSIGAASAGASVSKRIFGLSALIGLALATSVSALQSVDFRVSGSDADLKDALTGASLLHGLDDTALPADTVAAAQADYARLLEVLYAHGHYGASVRISLDGREAAQLSPLTPTKTIHKALITIDPGPAFVLGRTRIEPLAPDTTLPEEFRTGATARADTVRSAARVAVTGWRDTGHPKARIAGQAITARHTSSTLDVDVDIAPGPQARFGDVAVTGDTRVRAPRVRQIAGVPQGDRFDPDVVDKAANRLRSTGTFQSVTISEAETVAPDGDLDMTISVVDRKPRRVSAGAELSSLDGVTLSASWLHRNILRGAERLRLEGEITQLAGGGTGGPDLTLGARFGKPAVYGPDTLFYALAGAHYLDEPDYLEQGGDIGAGVSRSFSDALTGDLGLALSYAHITDRYLGRNAAGNYPTRTLTILSLPSALTLDRRDNALNAKDGYYLSGTVEPFTYLSGSGVGGGRVGLDARTYHTLDSDGGLVLAGRLQLGSLIGPEAADAPPEYLFYSGGGGTVRGQPYQSLDADYSGTALGGRSFAGLSTEIRAGVTDKISVVGFADAGYIGANSDFSSGDWHAGAGLGLRYDTSIGPIRVDLAAPVAGNTGNGIQLYIGIGQAF